MSEINWGIQVEEEILYPVRYTYHNGVRTFIPTFLKGKDMTFNQIKEYVRGYRIKTGQK